MVIVDTSVWIDHMNGTETPETAWLNREAGLQRLGLVDIVLCEVLQGVRSDRHAVETLSALTEFEVFPTGGTNLAIAAAQNHRRLRNRGFTVRKTIDCWIASFCLLEGHALLHNDRDFEPFERFLGLEVVHP